MDSDTLQAFLDEGLITDVLYQLKSGKEAAVWLCRKDERLLAAKVFKDHMSRAFHNDVVYRTGRAILDDRVARAVVSKTRFGREAAHAMWAGHEYKMLERMARIGADVPRVVGLAGGGILMDLVMYDGEPAPQLRETRPGSAEAQDILARVLWNIELMLADDVIHGDLSPFNVLLSDTGPVVIDFPQTVDPRSNPNARDLLFRDVDRVCAWGARFGAYEGAFSVASDLWDRWERAML